jgi:lipopolysaccharide transport system permease protein
MGLVVGFVMQLLMYATPVVYPFTSASQELKPWLQLNPLVAPFESFKYAFFGVGDFSTGSLLYSLAWMIVLMIVGVILFNKAEQNFMDNI